MEEYLNINYHEKENLPLLAWSATLQVNNGILNIEVKHGKNVEANKDFFVEGAWDAAFEKGEFAKSDFFMGTGAKLNFDDCSITFSTPNHNHERLQSLYKNGELYISNSLPFLMAESQTDIDVKYMNYESDFSTIIKGLNNYKKFIPLSGDYHVELHYYENITVDNNMNITRKRKYENIDGFENYSDYYEQLKKTLKRFKYNLNSDYRKMKYGVVTTISKGYDATACSVSARELGSNTALTFDEPEKYAEDNGETIAKSLGFSNIVKKNAHSYLTNNYEIEAEFLSTGELGNGIVFTAFEKEFNNNAVLIGERGDQIWSKKSNSVNDNFRFINGNPNISMTENRLRVGYILVLPPLFGAYLWSSINHISNTSSMKPYSIGGEYDRPIPRRIVEEKGVNRYEFGIQKKGAGFSYKFDNLKRIKNRMSPNSYLSFFEFYNSNKKNRSIVYTTVLKFIFVWQKRDKYINYIMSKTPLNFKFKNNYEENEISNPGAPSYLVPWGIVVMKNRYNHMLKIEESN